ncbi:MAG: 4-hydroxy-3-methylbut-2-enyl diphosphate reductase [Paludibacter sp.]|jgi:4-hydroxy-3-methylbut-2-enyl diphosphate reductase|nr:4-hydroxy-3-methylbut-2-enyl diphosphate reductase [Paludibacter sp.]
MTIIDHNSGFCFGVVKAICKAEEELANGNTLYCLGDIVHNNQEVERLSKLGLITIDRQQFAQLRDAKVLLSAHGEPPSTYQIAQQNNITLVDATCPVVLALQKRIKIAYEKSKTTDTQIVIYGKKGHAEVNGLMGQTDNKAIVVETSDDLENVDFERNISLFSQTTKPLDGFSKLQNKIEQKIAANVQFECADTICRQVSNRIPYIIDFARENDIVIFVSGIKSSNGKVFYDNARAVNPNTYFVTNEAELNNLNLDLTKRIGICGATSTPRWLMEKIEQRLIEMGA